MLILFIIIFGLILVNPNIAKESFILSSSLWFNSLVPIIYPTLIFIDLLANDKTLIMISNFLFKPFKYIFNINYPKSIILIILSFICGSPLNVKAITLSISNNEISEDEGNNLIYSYSAMSLPYTFYVFKIFNINIFIYLIISFILSSIIFYILNKNSKSITFSTSYKNQNIIYTLFNSIKNSVQTLLSILGIITIINILINLLFPNGLILYPLFEILGGINYIKEKSLSLILAIFSLGFLGLSVHMQILYINPNIHYIKFLIIRTLYSILLTLIWIVFV